MMLPQLDQDKANHALYCAVICTALMLVLPLAYTVAVTLSIAVAKEAVYDWYLKRGEASWQDMLANVLGIAVPVVASII